MILLIDNYDSFTYNIYQYVEELGFKCKVIRNDAVTVEDILELRPRKIVISPGPGHPDSAGVCLKAIRSLAGKIPILGVCLGHQAIAQAFGGSVVRAKRLMHGKTSQIHHKKRGIFKGLKSPFLAMRYHSLMVSKDGFPSELEVTAVTEDGIIMGLRHRKFPIEGVQFHPESYGTENGKQLLLNYLEA